MVADVALTCSACLRVGPTRVCPAIVIWFGGGQIRVGPRNKVLDGEGSYQPQKEHFWVGRVPDHCKYALRRVSLRWRCVLSSNYFGHLFQLRQPCPAIEPVTAEATKIVCKFVQVELFIIFFLRQDVYYVQTVYTTTETFIFSQLTAAHCDCCIAYWLIFACLSKSQWIDQNWYWVQKWKQKCIENESVPIQLAQCSFPWLAIFNTKKWKYIFEIKYTATTLSNSTLKLLWFEIAKMLIAVLKRKFTVLFIINFGTLSFFIYMIIRPHRSIY